MLAEDNMFKQANDFIRGVQTDEQKSKIKALYIEAMINFLEIFAQSEIGDVEVNIPAVALYVNSPEFENVDCFKIKDIDDIYKALEIETLMGLPIWRFLKLSEYQMNLFEKNYEDVLKERQEYLENTYPCKRCVYFKELTTPFGYLSQCNYTKNAFDRSRDRNIDWTNIKNCRNCITVNDDISKLKKKDSYLWRQTKNAQDSYKFKLDKRKLSDLDVYKITLKDLKEDCISLDSVRKVTDRTDYIFEGFIDAFNNKRSKSERIRELKKALCLEGFIKFVDLYIKTEIGNNFCVDISKSVLYLEKTEFEFESEEELFQKLENMILDGFSLKNFVKIK